MALIAMVFAVIFAVTLNTMAFTVAYSIFNKMDAIINLDDLINAHHKKDIVELMTQISPILSNKYRNVEFVVTSEKLDQIITDNIGITQLNINNKYSDLVIQQPLYGKDVYHDYSLKELKLLSKKINYQFSVIYTTKTKIESEENTFISSAIAIDYYISKISTIYNNNHSKKMYVVKNCDETILQPYWDLALPFKVLKIEPKEISLFSLSMIQSLDINIPYLISCEQMLE